ncbi:MAG: methyltransferase [Hyphococcus sp.]|nr:MAG: methyltransferase [Marinicaulis sp.]
MTLHCPVCRHEEVREFQTVAARVYLRCQRCEATFLDPAYYLTSDEERAHYDHHENEIEDPGYRKFLSKLADPLLAQLSKNSKGLDYGCGPGPALAAMLNEAGHEVSLYDPFFHADRTVLSREYDFITCTEVVEHFHEPAKEFDRLNDMLRCGGILAVMTCFQTDDEKFAAWHYRTDPTHVVFYREKTFHVLADIYDWRIDIPRKDVMLAVKQ